MHIKTVTTIHTRLKKMRPETLCLHLAAYSSSSERRNAVLAAFDTVRFGGSAAASARARSESALYMPLFWVSRKNVLTLFQNWRFGLVWILSRKKTNKNGTPQRAKIIQFIYIVETKMVKNVFKKVNYCGGCRYIAPFGCVKKGWFNASAAVIREFGSYVKHFRTKSKNR